MFRRKVVRDTISATRASISDVNEHAPGKRFTHPHSVIRSSCGICLDLAEPYRENSREQRLNCLLVSSDEASEGT